MTENLIARKYKKARQKLGAKMVRQVSKHFGSLARSPEGYLAHVARTIINRHTTYKLLPLVGYRRSSAPIQRLTEGCEYVSAAPRAIGELPQINRGVFPALHARLFSPAIIMGTSSAICADGGICIPEFYVDRAHALISDGDFLREQNDGMGVLRCANPETLESGIAVFGSGALNWYHWLIEILPAAFLSSDLPERYRDHPLLVPAGCLRVAAFRDSLSVFLADRKVVPLADRVSYRVRDLVFIDGAVLGPMNLRTQAWPVIADYSQHADVMLRYRRRILDHLAISKTLSKRRLFLARGNSRRNYNQSEIIAIAERFELEVVYPEQMTFREQVAMFASSSFVAGPSGAAFANMLFCQEGTKALTWVIPQYRQFCAYSNLAEMVGVELRYMFVTPEMEITSSFDAYGAAYVLDARAFENNLATMLGEI